MKVRVNAFTKPGFQLSVEDAMLMSGHAAGICYMRDDYDSIANEPVERTMKRANGTIKCRFGHYQCDRPCPLGPQHAFDRLI